MCDSSTRAPIRERLLKRRAHVGLPLDPNEILLEPLLFCHPVHRFAHDNARVPAARGGECLQKSRGLVVDDDLDLPRPFPPPQSILV
jgi:hypothetical protein